MTIKTELLAVMATSEDGLLHCEKVVEWARENPTSALHSAIEWNDDKAAHEHRLWQVRRLINVHITSEAAEERVISLSIDRKAGGGYRPISGVIAKPDLREIMLQDALDELERVQAKYSRIEALASVWRETERVREATGRNRKKAQAAA